MKRKVKALLTIQGARSLDAPVADYIENFYDVDAGRDLYRLYYKDGSTVVATPEEITFIE